MYLNTQIYTTLLYILIDVNFNYGKDLFQYSWDLIMNCFFAIYNYFLTLSE
jgi:hypothetical protein